MKRNYIIIAFFSIISFVLVFTFFKTLKQNEFIYMGDQFFRFNGFEAFINSFFVRKLENFGVLNGWQFTTQFWDVLYYLLFYIFSITFITAEKLLFFIVILLSLILSFMGFKKMHSLLNSSQNILTVLIITLWYCFNPYPVILWHGGVYNMGSALTYSLAPLILYYFHISVFTSSKLKDKIICAMLLSIASYTFWLFAPLAFALVLYSIIYLLFNIKSAPRFLKNVSILLIIYIPLICFVLFNILYEYYGNVGNNNSTFTPTFGNQVGGIWYQVLLLFSWGIYTVWTPRSMYSFHEYYFSKFYIIPAIIMYAIIFLGYTKYYLVSFFQNKNIKKKTAVSKIPVVILLILFISLFLAKAGQPPFGEVFLYLYNNAPFFSVFRTADIRFGFSVVLSIALLMLVSFREFNKYFLSFTILVILGFQSIFFFNGKVIKGENIRDLYYDRVVYYTKDYKEVINFINKDKSIATYVLPLPAIEYGHYTFDTNEHHFSQDLLPKLINKQFAYISLSNGMSSNAHKDLEKIIKNKLYDNLKKFPIKYLILRRDIICETCANFSEKEIGNKFKLVIKNKTFTVYEINNPTPIINSQNTTFQIINPVKFKISFRNVSKPQTLKLLTNFNKDWKIYISKNDEMQCDSEMHYTNKIKECVSYLKFFEGEDTSYLLKNAIFENTHKIANGYGNQWTINPLYIKTNLNKIFYTTNKDGSINFNLVIYYLPQSWFYLALLISVSTAISLIVLLVKYEIKSRSTKNISKSKL